MVQFKILSGKKAGANCVARRFPVRIGRSAASELQSDDDGVWDQHAQLAFDPDQGFVFSTCADAVATVNGQRVQQAILRNGDDIALGSLRLQFWLSETRQAGLRFREALTWIAIAAISLAQVALIYCLLR